MCSSDLAEPSFVALTEPCGLLMSTLPSAVAETLPIGLFTDTLPLSSTEMPTPGAWIETGPLELSEAVELAAGDDGVDGEEPSPDGDGG